MRLTLTLASILPQSAGFVDEPTLTGPETTALSPATTALNQRPVQTFEPGDHTTDTIAAKE